MARYDDLNTTGIAYGTLVSCLLLMILILLFRSLCYYLVEAEDARKLADAHYVEADSMISQQRARFENYEKVDVEVMVKESDEPDAKMVSETVEQQHIPLDKARDLILKELAGKSASPDA